jgi:hypothetical protein
LDLVVPAALVGLAISIARRDLFVPAWLVLLVVVPGGEGRYAALAWAMLASAGVTVVLAAARTAGAERLTAGIGIAFLLVASLLAGYQQFQALGSEVRSAAVAAGRSVPPDTRFGVKSDAAGGDEALLDWFPVLSGRRSAGTYMGLEFTSAARWKQALQDNWMIQAGMVPANVDVLFVVRDGRPTIEQVSLP